MITTYQQSKQNGGKKSSNKTFPGLLWGKLPERERELQTVQLRTPLHTYAAFLRS